MKPSLRLLHSPDVADLEGYATKIGEPFCILVQAMFGPEGAEGEESFDILVCSPEWFAENIGESEILSGSHHLIVRKFNYEPIFRYLVEFAERCTGTNWRECAAKLSRLGKWEFEGYRP